MPLGQGIEDMWEAVRDRIELSGHGPTWDVTAGSFEDALGYARSRFGDPVVLARRDRGRWWSRVTLTVTTDPALARTAPPLEQLAAPPVVPAQTSAATAADARPKRHRREVEKEQPSEDETAASDRPGLPASLEAIFDHQERQRAARGR